MLIVDYKKGFLKKVEKIKDNSAKLRVKKQVQKIIQNPEVGKPMMYARKGTREVYVGVFRLSYAYSVEESKITLLDLYHKDEQ